MAPAAGELSPSKQPQQAGDPSINALEIVSERSSNVPKDGRVEVLLKVRRIDNSGVVNNAPTISQWRVDGVAQNKNGKPFTGATLLINLTKGTHRVSVVSTNTEGKPLHTDADIDVNVKVKEESSVKVNPVTR
jgi:hypothetical protein